MRFRELQRIGQKIALQILYPLKVATLALILIAFLQLTGLMSSVSTLGNELILATGLKDADDEHISPEEDFNFQFTIKDLDGKKLPFDQFKGKVIFLNMWATWCGPCRAEMPGIQSLYEKMDKQKVVFVMLSIDKDSDHPKVVEYLKKRKFTFTGYMPSGYLPEQLQVPAIPTTFVISAAGKIVRKEVGGMNYDTPKFQKFLESMTQ